MELWGRLASLANEGSGISNLLIYKREVLISLGFIFSGFNESINSV